MSFLSLISLIFKTFDIINIENIDAKKIKSARNRYIVSFILLWMSYAYLAYRCTAGWDIDNIFDYLIFFCISSLTIILPYTLVDCKNIFKVYPYNIGIYVLSEGGKKVDHIGFLNDIDYGNITIDMHYSATKKFLFETVLSHTIKYKNKKLFILIDGEFDSENQVLNLSHNDNYFQQFLDDECV